VGELPRGTVTFLFTDIEGSTRLLQELGSEGYARALVEHRRVLREAFERYGGVEVDTQGDAFFVAFPTAPGALEAAREAQDALELSVRMGLHTGTPLLTEEGYVGADVHRAARIAAAGHGGQLLLSATTKELADATVVDLGEHRLKDFDDPVRIFQLGDGQFPPLKTISNTNLPRPASSFVGRHREVAEVVAILRDGTRLLTLAGPGGAGKTRLAVEAATELVPDFDSGVFWVALATVRDPSLVMDTVAKALGAKDGVAAHIGNRELLLLLDNFEQVVETAPELSELLDACPNLRLLVTSRELLRIEGEVEYPVPPLAEGEAVELFCVRSRLEPDEDIGVLCRRLDDLPLAVELAAARTSVLTPGQIVERIGQRLDLLKGGRATDPRQQTLRATIEWSTDLLSDEEQHLFARLAVFSGGCTLAAAEEILKADLDTLQALVEKSLVRFNSGRFWMLETIREFALERLEELPEAASLGRRHAEHYLRFAEERRWANTRAILDELEADHDNIRAARAWFEANGEIDSELELAAALAGLADTHGHWREELAATESALARASGATPAAQALGWQALANAVYCAGDLRRAEDAGGRALALHRSVGNDLAASAVLIVLGVIAAEGGDYARATALFAEGRELSGRLGERRLLSSATQNLGLYALLRGDLDEARALTDEALEISRELGDERGIVPSLENLGIIALWEGSLDRAGELLRESLEHAQAIESPFGIFNALVGLAALAAAEGRPERAGQLLGAADAVREEAEAERYEVLEARLHEETTERLRGELGEVGLAAAYADGRSLSLNDAVAYALGDG
jgi:predicted ATPase